MKMTGIYFRINYTRECFYYIDFDNQQIEVVYDMDEAYRSVKRIAYDPKLARELVHTLYEIKGEVYQAAKQYVLLMLQVKLDPMGNG
ncbi:MAG: hypothetical protein AAF655_12415 [Bacteroidota bacterium]